jgi:hypothetical protein
MTKELFYVRHDETNPELWTVYGDFEKGNKELCITKSKKLAQRIVNALNVWTLLEDVALAWDDLEKVRNEETQFEGAPIFVRRKHMEEIETANQAFYDAMETLIRVTRYANS